MPHLFQPPCCNLGGMHNGDARSNAILPPYKVQDAKLRPGTTIGELQTGDRSEKERTWHNKCCAGVYFTPPARASLQDVFGKAGERSKSQRYWWH
jgi:hypothetical protein